jgi:hypothetical protein
MVQPLTPGTVPANKGAKSHLIADSHLRDYTESWVLCDCGEMVRAGNAKSAAAAFDAHRRASGLPPVGIVSEREIAEWRERQKVIASKGRPLGAHEPLRAVRSA